MTLREKIEHLLTTKVPRDERTMLQFVLDSVPEGPLEDTLYPDVRAHIEGRYEWYFKPNGALRRAA